MKRKSAAIFFNYQFKDAAKAAINELHEAKIWTEKRTIDFSTISEYIYLSRNCPFCEYSSKVSIFLRTLNIMVFVENPLDDVVNSFDHFKWRETITRDMTRVLLHLQNELEKVGVVFGCDGYKLYDVHDQENFLSVNDKKTGFLTGGTDLIIAPHGIEELEKVSKQNCVTFKLKTAEEVKEKGLEIFADEVVMELIASSYHRGQMTLVVLTDLNSSCMMLILTYEGNRVNISTFTDVSLDQMVRFVNSLLERNCIPNGNYSLPTEDEGIKDCEVLMKAWKKDRVTLEKVDDVSVGSKRKLAT